MSKRPVLYSLRRATGACFQVAVELAKPILSIVPVHPSFGESYFRKDDRDDSPLEAVPGLFQAPV